MFYKRDLDLKKLLEAKSHFLFGPRSTGKSAWIKKSFPDVILINLLEQDSFERYLRKPSLIREELLAKDLAPDSIIIIDEIQKIPALLDEVHWLIEEKKFRFLLTGSSARKLKQKGTNLLAGRAWRQSFHPLTSNEITDFDLKKYINVGGLPQVYTSPLPYEELKNYVNLYIREEIQYEGLVRKLDQFSRFMDSIGIMNAKEINYTGWASDISVPAKTLETYIHLLEDTLLAFQLPSFTKTVKRKAIKRPKFYFFDVGVANYLGNRKEIQFKSTDFGEAFEHFIIQEIRAAISYQNKDIDMTYWRSTSQMEVDLCLGNDTAIEIKSSERITQSHLKGLKALKDENIFKKYYVVSMDKVKRNMDGIEIIPYKEFLDMLWSKKIL